MIRSDLERIRQKLNHMIENGAEYEEILRISVELDNIIEEYMEENKLAQRL